jgi:hypothetical protein
MFERISDSIFAPIRLLRSKIFRIKQMPSNVKGEIGRVKNEARMYGGEAKGVASKAKGAGGQAQAAAQSASKVKPQSQPKRKMGWFSKKRKCDGCGQKLHPSWQECPYCGYGKAAAPGPVGGAAPAGGAPQRTMALDTGSAAPAGTGMIGWFIPLEGSRMGELITLRGRVSVGAAPDNDVVITEASISGHHCEFVGSATGFKLNDLGSTNGTFVNDKRIQTHDLVDNDNVLLGRVRFKFKSLV